MSDLSISLEALERSRSQLSVTSYFDERLFRREMELIYQHGPRYVGHEPYKRALLAQAFPLPPGMRFEAVATGTALPLRPAEHRVVPIRIRVPDDARTGTEYTINVRAEDAEGRLEGGLTFLLRVKY